VRTLDSLKVDRSVLLETQEANLALMRAAITRSPTCAAFRPYADALTPDRLRELPLMTREKLATWGCRPDAPHRITTGDTRLVLRSSGSSGRVRTLLHDRPFNDRVEALGARGLCCEELGDNPFVVNALAGGDLFGGFGFADAVLARRGAAVLPAGISLAPHHLAELLADHDVRAMVSLPGYYAQLWQKIPEALAGLHTLYYLGDRMASGIVGELAAHGVRVRSFAYSTTETGPIGYQCAHLAGAAHHVHEDLVVAEVVDDNGRPLPDGEAGDLAVTVLADTGTALVRYLVGDHAVLEPSDCPCGSPARVLTIGARDDVSANINGALVTRAMFDEALRPLGLPREAAYQVAVHSTDGVFSLSLRGPALHGITADAALAALGGHQALRRLTGSARFAGLSVDTETTPRLNNRAKAPFFWHEGDSDDRIRDR
jgi:phenylacetate-CoA ligase